eukprot:TRINITY_DN8195_c0_g1_i1.p1 TRINITY_DN8195_c0_g1~~TRINITY_DN8195_c0_g1_i1.p1  ORF type:complete len:603 (+),score=136.26 TRINITY_DN8195_c0_g1_i1:83-1891(+)
MSSHDSALAFPSSPRQLEKEHGPAEQRGADAFNRLLDDQKTGRYDHRHTSMSAVNTREDRLETKGIGVFGATVNGFQSSSEVPFDGSAEVGTDKVVQLQIRIQERLRSLETEQQNQLMRMRHTMEEQLAAACEAAEAAAKRLLQDDMQKYVATKLAQAAEEEERWRSDFQDNVSAQMFQADQQQQELRDELKELRRTIQEQTSLPMRLAQTQQLQQQLRHDFEELRVSLRGKELRKAFHEEVTESCRFRNEAKDAVSRFVESLRLLQDVQDDAKQSERETLEILQEMIDERLGDVGEEAEDSRTCPVDVEETRRLLREGLVKQLVPEFEQVQAAVASLQGCESQTVSDDQPLLSEERKGLDQIQTALRQKATSPRRQADSDEARLTSSAILGQTRDALDKVVTLFEDMQQICATQHAQARAIDGGESCTKATDFLKRVDALGKELDSLVSRQRLTSNRADVSGEFRVDGDPTGEVATKAMVTSSHMSDASGRDANGFHAAENRSGLEDASGVYCEREHRSGARGITPGESKSSLQGLDYVHVRHEQQLAQHAEELQHLREEFKRISDTRIALQPESKVRASSGLSPQRREETQLTTVSYMSL